jgi:hypothetical protein
VARLKRSEAFEAATVQARSAVEEAVGKAKAVVDEKTGNSTTNGHGADAGSATAGIILPTDPPTGLGGYSSSR